MSNKFFLLSLAPLKELFTKKVLEGGLFSLVEGKMIYCFKIGRSLSLSLKGRGVERKMICCFKSRCKSWFFKK